MKIIMKEYTENIQTRHNKKKQKMRFNILNKSKQTNYLMKQQNSYENQEKTSIKYYHILKTKIFPIQTTGQNYFST